MIFFCTFLDYIFCLKYFEEWNFCRTFAAGLGRAFYRQRNWRALGLVCVGFCVKPPAELAGTGAGVWVCVKPPAELADMWGCGGGFCVCRAVFLDCF